MSKAQFKARYEVQDGYASGAEKVFSIGADELEDGMTDSDLRQYYDESVQYHFEQNVFPAGTNADGFVAWALEQISKRTRDQQ